MHNILKSIAIMFMAAMAFFLFPSTTYAQGKGKGQDKKEM